MQSTLGLVWNIDKDHFQFKLKTRVQKETRRGHLSDINGIYDPIGLLGPFILKGRQILQSLCKSNLKWDDVVPEKVSNEWERWWTNLKYVEDLEIPRCYYPYVNEVTSINLHTICDASDKGYGIASYLQFIDNESNIHCQIVYARSRVAPLKFVSIPRMELSAALLAAKSSNMLKMELSVPINQCFFWTDSQSVLGYLHNEARRFKVFMANRIQQIHDLTNIRQWQHVATHENPANFTSRGLTMKQKEKVSIWFNGPNFLCDAKSLVNTPDRYDVPNNDPELKVTVKANMTKNNTSLLCHLLSRTSSWKKLKGIMKVVIKFTLIASKKKCPDDMILLEEAQKCIIKMAQIECFKYELKQLIADQKIAKTSCIHRLDPFVDKENLLRVGGRLKNAEFPFNEKHPIIIPNGKLGEIIGTYFHEKMQHSGRGITLNSIRRARFWIVGVNSIVKSLITKCVTCKKLYGYFGKQKMANLPDARVKATSPFTYCGVDMFGPFDIRCRRSILKRYCAMFTCLNSRAVHLEICSDLSTDSFILALRRFICSRGNVRVMYFDNGTNFVGTNNELLKAVMEEGEERIKSYLLDQGAQWLDWKFNPPAGSHYGGVWERQIRSARRILESILHHHGSTLTDELLRMFIVETEAVINSRPLTVETINDHQSLMPLSPSNLLTLKSYVILPPPGVFEKPDLYCKRHWRRIQFLVNQFWDRWRKEYLQALQVRQKWYHPEQNFKEGDLVLLKDQAPRNQWPLGRVVSTEQSKDGLVRTENVCVGGKEPRNILNRPITKLVKILDT